MPKPDWIKIKNEYISTGISYRKLAEKYSVSFPTLRDRAKRESWQSERDKQRDKIVTKTSQKTAEKMAERESDLVIDMAALNRLASLRAQEKLANGDITARDLKSVTGALKDINDIAKAQPPKTAEQLAEAIGRLAEAFNNPVENRELPREDKADGCINC